VWSVQQIATGRIESQGRQNIPAQSQPTLGPTQSPVRWVLDHFSRCRVARVGVLITHPHLVLRLKKEYSHTFTPLWAFVACFREKFTLPFISSYHVIKIWIIVHHSFYCSFHFLSRKVLFLYSTCEVFCGYDCCSSLLLYNWSQLNHHHHNHNHYLPKLASYIVLFIVRLTQQCDIKLHCKQLM